MKRSRIGAAGLAAALFLAALLPGEAGAATVRLLDGGLAVQPGPVTSLLVAEGTLFVGTAGKGLVAYDLGSGKAVRYTGKEGLPSAEIRSLARYRGKVYAGTAEGIAVLEGGRWSTIEGAGRVRFRNVILAASPDGKELWAASVHLSGGTVRYDGKNWVFVGGEGRGLFNEVNSFAFVSGGVLMGAMSGTVYEVKGGEIEAFSKGFPAANVLAVGERGGTVYAGTNRGLFLMRGDSWSAALLPEPFAGTAVFAILRSGLDLFIGGKGGLLLLDGKGRTRNLSAGGGFPPGPVTALAEDDGTVYAATENGVAALSGWRE